MAVGDAERWDDRYADVGASGGTTVPAAPDVVDGAGLGTLFPHDGRALDVAAGAGAQSLWLAARGLHVDALDVSGAAARLVTAAAVEHGLDARITVTVLDLDDGIPPSLGDFDVIICQRFRATHLYEEFVDRLVPGGIAVVTVLSVTGADEPGPFHAPAGELAAAFDRPDVEIVARTEGGGQESIVLRRGPIAS